MRLRGCTQAGGEAAPSRLSRAEVQKNIGAIGTIDELRHEMLKSASREVDLAKQLNSALAR
eukprot:8591901-Pyramimonas_sp.AAC.2